MLDKIFFCSGGFYAINNHFGAIKELHKEYNSPNSCISRNIVYYGVSAGAIASVLCYLVLENLITLDKAHELVTFMNTLNMIDLNITSVGINMIDRLFDCCPLDLFERISNVINIGVTTKDGYKQISTFTSNADLYNVILCSCTIAGVFNYDSQINGELCIDGVYSFKYGYLPPDTLIIKLSLFSWPITLTVPPPIMQGLLLEMGRKSVVDYVNNNRPVINDDDNNSKQIKVRNILGVNEWLFIHGLTYKNPMWKKHIEFKTNSKLPGSVNLHVGLFDIINYVHYSILNHRS